MYKRANAIIALAAILVLLPAAALALQPFLQDFEGLPQNNPNSLADDGWLVFGNVFGLDWSYWYGYGPFPAPNGTGAFCDVASGEGGAEQGSQQLVVYSDYNNGDHPVAYIESNVFQEQLIGPGDVTETWVFDFQAKRGNLAGGSTALAFIKVLNPATGYSLSRFETLDMTAIPTTWGGYSLSLLIEPDLDGQILQFGFLNVATNYEPSGIFYDNVRWHISGTVPADEKSFGEVKALFR